MAEHHIKLQSSVGDFDPAFVEALPALEKAMRERGLDPSAFVIARNLSQSPHLPIFYRPDGNLLEYTVFVNDRSFTVTQPNDMRFLEYFHDLCCPPERKDDPHSIGHRLRSEEEKWPRSSTAPRAGSTSRSSLPRTHNPAAPHLAGKFTVIAAPDRRKPIDRIKASSIRGGETVGRTCSFKSAAASCAPLD